MGVVADQDDPVGRMRRRELELGALVLVGVEAVVDEEADPPAFESARKRLDGVADDQGHELPEVIVEQPARGRNDVEGEEVAVGPLRDVALDRPGQQGGPEPVSRAGLDRERGLRPAQRRVPAESPPEQGVVLQPPPEIGVVSASAIRDRISAWGAPRAPATTRASSSRLAIS